MGEREGVRGGEEGKGLREGEGGEREWVRGEEEGKGVRGREGGKGVRGGGETEEGISYVLNYG